MTDWIGYWETEAPLEPDEQSADIALLSKINIPEGVTINRMTVWVHGREWEWQRVNATVMR